MSGRKGRPVLPQVLCGLLLSFTVFIFAPIDMVVLNSINFWFDIYDFLPAFAILFVLAFAAIEAVYLLFRKLPYSIWLLMLSLLFSCTVCVYIQGTYLCLGSEALTSGDPIWREMLGEMLLNMAIWAAVIMACAAFSLLRPKLFTKVVCVVCALILVMESSALVMLLTRNSMSSDITRIYCSDEEQFTFSPNGDVIVVMLDTFDKRLMDRAMEEDPDYADVFEDFTYYRNAASSTSLTDTSFMSFMTGEVCLNEEPFFLYCRRAMRESAFIPTMKENGMTVQIYAAPDGVFSDEQMGLVSNLRVREAHIGSQIEFAKEMLCMIGYRYMPKVMQPFLLRDYVGSFDKLQVMDYRGVRESTENNPAFIRKFREEGVEIDESRRFFKFFLLHGAHKPEQMNRYMEEVPAEQTNQYEQLMGCFAMLKELFGKLREKGVYDEATVIVMGDHGINDDWRNGVCNPAFLVKYPHEKGAMRISDAPVSLLDMRATALYGAGIDHEAVGTPAHMWEGIEDRERIYMMYYYDVPSSYKFYLNDISEYIVPQDAADLDAYVPTGRVFPKKQ